jgi:hypothetical protein
MFIPWSQLFQTWMIPRVLPEYHIIPFCRFQPIVKRISNLHDSQSCDGDEEGGVEGGEGDVERGLACWVNY